LQPCTCHGGHRPTFSTSAPQDDDVSAVQQPDTDTATSPLPLPLCSVFHITYTPAGMLPVFFNKAHQRVRHRMIPRRLPVMRHAQARPAHPRV